MLYSLNTTAGDGYIHVLIEHQSTPDRHVAFRLMRYAVAAMQRHLDAGHKKLPLVIPVLFYTGRRSPYPYSTDWRQEFDDPALTLLQKHIHRRDLADLVDRLAATLLAGHLTGQQLVSRINYLVQAGETDDAEAFVRNLAQRVPQHEDELMTIAQQLEQKGLEKGRLEGRQEGKMEVARNLLQKGIPLESVRELTGLSDDDLKKIRH